MKSPSIMSKPVFNCWFLLTMMCYPLVFFSPESMGWKVIGMTLLTIAGVLSMLSGDQYEKLNK